MSLARPASASAAAARLPVLWSRRHNISGQSLLSSPQRHRQGGATQVLGRPRSTAQVHIGVRAVAAEPMDSAALMEGFHRCVASCNDAGDAQSQFVPWTVEGKVAGYLTQEMVQALSNYPDVFSVVAGDSVELNGSLRTIEARNAAMAKVTADLRDKGVITGWRDELFPVVQSFSSEPLLLVERAAATQLGIKAYGVHINGFVRRPDGSKQLWVGRRSKTKQTWPGMLDHIVAGGQPHGISPQENVVKECGEEAGIPPALAAAAVPAGAVSYSCMYKGNLKRDVMFVYDIELPESFVPQPQDGEVEEFMLWPMSKVMQVVAEGVQFKPNCQLIIIDFLIRHGHITPEQHGYLELLASLRSGDCS